MDRLPAWLQSFAALAWDTIKDAREDRVLGLGAEVAFFSILSLPPTLLAVFGSVGYIAEALGPESTQEIRDSILGASGTFLTPGAIEQLEGLVDTFLSEGQAGVASIGVVLALWSASRATNVSIEAVNIAYDLSEIRSGLHRRVIALGMTFLGILGAIVLIPLIVAGPRLGEALGRPLGLGEVFATLWRYLYWPGVGLVGIVVLAAFYHYAPSWRTPWRRDVPGAVLAAVLWLVGGAGLRIYAILSVRGNVAYRGLAAPIVLLLWVYLTSLAVLLGAEFNAEIEKRWPTIEGPHGPEAQAAGAGAEPMAAPIPAGPWPPKATESETK